MVLELLELFIFKTPIKDFIAEINDINIYSYYLFKFYERY